MDTAQTHAENISDELEDLKALKAELTESLAEMKVVMSGVRQVGASVWKAVWTILGGAFLIGVWVATLEFRQHDVAEKNETTKARVDDAQTKLATMELWKAETNGNRFTSNDGARMMETLQASLNGHNLRLQRTEDAMVSIQNSLERIEAKLFHESAAMAPGGR